MGAFWVVRSNVVSNLQTPSRLQGGDLESGGQRLRSNGSVRLSYRIG